MGHTGLAVNTPRLPIVLVLVFLPVFRLPPSKIEDEHDNDNEHD
jgi:hypothetical protein